MGMLQKSALRKIVIAVVAFACAIALVPCVALAENGVQTVKSAWTEVINVDAAEPYTYNWCVRMTITVEDGLVTGASCASMRVGGGDMPSGEREYYDGKHEIMEWYIEAEEIDATNPDAVDSIDTVSGATYTSIAIKSATKDALVKWGEKAQQAQPAIDAINAIESSDDKEAAVKAARAAYDALSADLQTYVSRSSYELLANAEAEIEAAKQEADLSNGTAVLSQATYTFANTSFTPSVVVKTKNGVTLTKDVHYTVAYENNKNAGTAKVIVQGKDPYTGSITKQFTIAPATQTIKAAKAYKVKLSKVKKAKQTVAVKFTADGGGKITYAKAKNGKVSIAKNGKVTVAKGAKKGTYTLKVKVTAAAKGNYAKTTKTVALKVKVA